MNADPPTTRGAPRLAWLLWGIAITLAAGHVALQILARDVKASRGFGFPGFGAILTVVFASVGALVASRQPRNAIGWAFVAVGLESGIQGLGLAYALNGILGAGRGAPWPGAEIGAWLNAWFWFPAIMAVTLVFHVFPDGRFLSPRWRTVALISIVFVVMGSAGLALQPGPLENFGATNNPFGVEGSLVKGITDAGFTFSNLLILTAVASLIVRYRRSGTTVREQIKWVAYAAVVVGVSLPIGDFFGTQSRVIDALIISSVAFVPISVGIAILRFRLYDIDHIISRTVSYAALSAVLALTYLLVALVPLAIAGRSGPRPPWLVAGATLLAAAVFRPLRRRTQTTVDRRFNRSRYDAMRTIDVFSARLRDQVDVEALGAELRGVVAQTMQPAHVSVWLLER